jgi:type I restriction enzyme S subunit
MFAPLSYGKSLPKNDRNNGSIPIYGSNGTIRYNNRCYVNNAGIIIGRKGTIGTVHISIHGSL